MCSSFAGLSLLIRLISVVWSHCVHSHRSYGFVESDVGHSGFVFEVWVVLSFERLQLLKLK